VVGNSLFAALLGNEHKARVDGRNPSQNRSGHAPGVVAVAHGSVELPTDQQALATPQVEGRVRRILVKPSQQVTKGEVLSKSTVFNCDRFSWICCRRSRRRG
jgi:hypothetical protein